MLAHADLATFLSLLLVGTTIGLLLQRQEARRGRREVARRLAVATGHPSAGMVPDREGAQRAAEGLAGLGLVAERIGMRVFARALAGEYVLTVTDRGIYLVYRFHGGQQLFLGHFRDVADAVAEVARHGELRSTA